jgi:WD40 repeat protein
LIATRTRKQLAEVSLGAAAALRMAFTKDGSQLAVVESTREGGSGWIAIRDAATLNQIGSPIKPEGFTGSFISQWWTHPDVALAPDGRSLVTTSVEGELAWWDLDSRKKTRTIEIEDGYRALALSHDGRTAAIGLDRGIRLINVRTGTAKEARGALASSPIRLLFSPDDKTVVSTNIDGTVTLWNAAAATPSETLRGHSRTVWEPVFSADGKTLYTGSSDGTVIAWDLSGDRRLERRFTFTHDRGLSGWPDRHPGKFSPDGRLIAVGLKAEGIELRSTGDPARPGTRLQPTGGEVTALAFSPDGGTLAAVTKDGAATIWDVESRSLQHGPFYVTSYAVGVSISADGTMLATAGGYGVQLWDVATGASLGSIGDGRNAGDVAFSPTEPLVAFVVDGYLQSGGGDAEIWGVGPGRRQDEVVQGGSLVTTVHIDDHAGVLGWAVAFSADGRMLATSGIDALVHLWDVRSGKLIREIEQNVGNAVWALEFTPDGRTLAISGGDSFASLWDVATGAQIGPRLGAGSRESMLDLSPDGRDLLITSGNGQGAIWRIDPESWPQRACALANRTLTREEWDEFLPGRPYEPACQE